MLPPIGLNYLNLIPINHCLPSSNPFLPHLPSPIPSYNRRNEVLQLWKLDTI